MTISSLGTSLSSFGQTLRCSIRASSLRWTWWKWIVLDSVAVNTFTGTLTSPKVKVPFHSERAAMAPDYPGSVQEHRDLVDRRALRDALLLARVAEVQEADRELVLGQPRRRAARGRLEHGHGAPVAREAARVRAEQHDVGRHRGREHVLVVLRGVAGLLGRRDDQRGRAVELGRRARLGLLGGVLERRLG